MSGKVWIQITEITLTIHRKNLNYVETQIIIEFSTDFCKGAQLCLLSKIFLGNDFDTLASTIPTQLLTIDLKH